MNQSRIRVFGLLPCAALIAGAAALQASTVKSEKFEIPFNFQVQKTKTLPAGEYQVQQDEGSSFATLVNTRTGERVQLLRPSNTHKQGKARLVFENTESGHELKQIS